VSGAPDFVIPEEPEEGEGEERDALRTVIETLQLTVLKHPVASQAAYRALVAEGRRFATTPEGRAWRERLECSPEVARLRSVWEVGTFNALTTTDTAALPAPLIDLIAQLASRTDLERATVALSDAASSMPFRGES
jgi:hypothetical protein